MAQSFEESMLRKRSWRNLWYYLGIFMEGRGRTTKAFVHGSWFQSSHFRLSFSVTVQRFLNSLIVEMPPADRRGE